MAPPRLPYLLLLLAASAAGRATDPEFFDSSAHGGGGGGGGRNPRQDDAAMTDAGGDMMDMMMMGAPMGMDMGMGMGMGMAMGGSDQPKPSDPDIGPVWNSVTCLACGMRGNDAIDQNWPACEDDHSQSVDACGGGRMRCYVLYGEYDWEIFGRKVISKGCTYATYFQFASSRRRRRSITGRNEVNKVEAAQQRDKRHLGMLGPGACGFMSSQIPVYHGWNLTHELMPICMCDNKDYCNSDDLACNYDDSVCRNASTPDPNPRRRRGSGAAPSAVATLAAVAAPAAAALILAARSRLG